MTGLPEDPSDRPTRMAHYGADASRRQILESESLDGTDAAPDFAPDPWYRNRVLVALWALMVALLLTLIIYGIVELSRGGGSSVPAPHTSTTTTTPQRSSTTSPSPTSTTSPSPTTTTTEAPPPETPEQTPEQAPPPANTSPAPTEPPHHHHHWHLPHIF